MLPSLELGSINFQESLWYSVCSSNSNRVALGIVYRSPDSGTENKSVNEFKLQDYSSNLLIVGDFNFPNVN